MRRPLVALLVLASCAGPGASQPPSQLATAPLAAGAPRSDAADPSNVEWTALQRLVAARLGRLRPCYQRELALDPALESKMAIEIFVTPAGKVADMTLMDAYQADEPQRPTTILSDAMARCLGVEVMTWVFPATTLEGKVQLVKPPAFIASFSAHPIDKSQEMHVYRDTKEKVRQLIRAGDPAYRTCYEAYLDRGGAGGPFRVKAQIRIRNDGTVEAASVLDPPVLEAPFRDCMVGMLRKLAFGKLEGDGIMIVEYPFVFEPGP
jgi:hypothetical protein